MGRQIAVCLIREDVDALEEEFRTGEAFCILPDLSETPEAEEAAGGLSEPRRGAFLVRKTDLGHVRFQAIPGKSLYYVDSFVSPVVEFSPCYHRNSELLSGRLLVVVRYFQGEQLFEKPDEFLKWSSWLFARCKKTLKYDRATHTYWGKEAAKLRDSSQLTYRSMADRVVRPVKESD